MRAFLLGIFVAISLNSLAASEIASNHKLVAGKQSKAEQPKESARLDTTSIEKTIREEIKETGDKHDPNADERLKNERKLVEDTSELAIQTNRLASFTLWLVFVTICLAAIAMGQLFMFWRQLGLMKDEASNAKSVAEASLAQANSLISSTRAHIFVKRIQYEPIFDHIENRTFIRAWKLYPVFENGGSTPTKHCVMHVSFWRGPNDEISQVDNGFPDLWFEGEPKELSPFFIGPKAEKWSSPIEISVVDLEEIKLGTEKFFMWGWIDYDDVLDDTPRHRTEFGYGMFVTGDFTSTHCTFLFRELDEFNGIDDDCYRSPQPYQRKPPRA